MINHSVFHQSQLPSIDYTKETVAVLASAGGNNYFHWMFDILPRTDLLYSSGLNVDRFIINNNEHLPYQQETLLTLGIDEVRLIGTHQRFHLQADQLVVPSLPGNTGNPPQWVCNFLRNKFLDNKTITRSDRYDRIYISRWNATLRKILNETEVMDLLAKYGFRNVLLDSMTVADQALLLSSAKVVAWRCP